MDITGKVYTRMVTLSQLVKNEELGTISGINDWGSKVVMTIKQFEELYTLKD